MFVFLKKAQCRIQTISKQAVSVSSLSDQNTFFSFKEEYFPEWV